MAAAPVSPAVARQAVEWLVELQSGACDDALLQGLARWRAEHPEHEHAWQHIAAVNAQWRGAVGSSAATARLAAQMARTALLEAPPAPAGRRGALKTAAVLLGVGGGAWLMREHTPWAWSADERTGVGQRRTLTLADGTVLDLNTDSAVAIGYTATERRIRLAGGEIVVRTGKDGAGRPLIVETAEGTLQPLGTRFAVRQQAGSSRVDVFEGAVAIRPRRAPAAAMRILRAGQQAGFSQDAVAAVRAADDDGIAWTDGMLVASGVRLDAFLAELGRHRHGRLGCDPAIAGLRVSGTYPLADTDRILDTLRTTLPVEIHFLTRYWVTLRPARR